LRYKEEYSNTNREYIETLVVRRRLAKKEHKGRRKVKETRMVGIWEDEGVLDETTKVARQGTMGTYNLRVGRECDRTGGRIVKCCEWMRDREGWRD
jgi:hypothetical protein